MDAKKIFMAGLVAGIAAFFLGWIIYGMLLMDFYASNAGTATNVARAESEMVWWALIVGNLFFGFALSYVYGRWANISTAKTGAEAGAMIGLLFGGGWVLTMFASTNIYNLTATLVDVLVSAILTALVGAVAGWMLGRLK